MAVLEPPYTQYPAQNAPSTGTLAPGSVIPGGESDSGLPGSAGTPSNFITDLLGPRYQKYAYPPVVLPNGGIPRSGT